MKRDTALETTSIMLLMIAKQMDVAGPKDDVVRNFTKGEISTSMIVSKKPCWRFIFSIEILKHDTVFIISCGCNFQICLLYCTRSNTIVLVSQGSSYTGGGRANKPKQCLLSKEHEEMMMCDQDSLEIRGHVQGFSYDGIELVTLRANSPDKKCKLYSKDSE